MTTWNHWKQTANNLKHQIYTLYVAYQDPRVPWYAKVFIAAIVAYAVSPIDLIPDFIPILGYLDDLILLPIAIVLAISMIPDDVWNDAKRIVARRGTQRLHSKAGLLIVMSVWLACAVITYCVVRIIW